MSAIGRKQEQPTGKVLVLGYGHKNFLSVVRSLGRRNLQVHVGWGSPSSLALHSRYIYRVHDIPPFSPSDDSWKDSLIAILQQERFDLVIPCIDEAILPLQTHRTELEHYAPLYLLDDDAFEVAYNKFKTNDLARSVAIPLPREIRVTSIQEAGRILQEFDFPVVLKPTTSYTLDDLANKIHVRKAFNAEELHQYLGELLRHGDVQVQENVIGTGVGVAVLAERGETFVAFQQIRIHEPFRGGPSSYRKSAPLNTGLLEAAKRLINALNYTGVAHMEFKVDFKTGQWTFIELNGRFWGSLPLAISARADFPYYLYQLLVEGKRDFPQEYKTGIYCRNLLEDVRWMRHNIRADKSDPFLATLPLRRVAKEIVTVLTFRERSDTLVIDDPIPGFFELVSLIRKLVWWATEKMNLFPFSIRPIRKIYTMKARRAMEGARSVLFVCKGNICRSPFAQHYAQTVFRETKRIMSAGYYPEKGRCCPDQAVSVAGELGIDLNQHRSSVLSEENVCEAQIIFALDEEDRKTLTNRYPFAKQKVYLLGLLALNGAVSVMDPFGGGINDYRTAYQLIQRALDSINTLIGTQE